MTLDAKVYGAPFRRCIRGSLRQQKTDGTFQVLDAAGVKSEHKPSEREFPGTAQYLEVIYRCRREVTTASRLCQSLDCNSMQQTRPCSSSSSIVSNDESGADVATFVLRATCGANLRDERALAWTEEGRWCESGQFDLFFLFFS